MTYIAHFKLGLKSKVKNFHSPGKEMKLKPLVQHGSWPREVPRLAELPTYLLGALEEENAGIER